ncbi:MAG: septal ring lytic transglycosylase RlpA family protein [Chitinophagaceae bacterium]|nr:MAG: septal ring lytic transglycosylase RlpA family protein [Chitinophagaceae bacterium]
MIRQRYKPGKPILTVVFFLLFSAITIAQAEKKESKDKETSASKAKKSANRILYGQASFYANKFEGRKTASGEIFRHSKLTAACNSLPLGTWIKITNLKNGKTVVVKTNDRLHTKTRRLVDLTRTAAQKLGFIKSGLTRVKVEVLKKKPASYMVCKKSVDFVICISGRKQLLPVV